MILTMYKMTNDPRNVTKTLSIGTTYSSFHYVNPVDLMTPTIDITLDRNVDYSSVGSYNYCLINSGNLLNPRNRYYFVDSVTFLDGNIVRLKLREDVLSTFSSVITASMILARRSQSSGSYLLRDQEMPVLAEKERFIYDSGDNGKFTFKSYSDIAAANQPPNYVLTCGADYSALTSDQQSFLDTYTYPIYPHIKDNSGALHYAIAPGATTTTRLSVKTSVLCTSTILDLFKPDKSSAIVSFKAYPFDVRNFVFSYDSAYRNIVVGTDDNLGVNAILLGDPVKTQVASFVIPIGGFTADAATTTYLDFEPYTKVKAYLPFLGWVDIPAAKAIGKTLKFYYIVDFSTGEATCSIDSVSGGTTETNIVSKSGNVAIDFPLGSSNAQEKMRQVLSNGISLIGNAAGAAMGAALNNPFMLSGALMGAVRNVNSLANNSIVDFKAEQGKGGGIAGRLGYDKVVVIVERPKLYRYENLDTHISSRGLPTHREAVGSTFTGYLEAEDVIISDSVGMTTAERDELISLLKSGVFM